MAKIEGELLNYQMAGPSTEDEANHRRLLERELCAVIVKFCRQHFTFTDSARFVGALSFSIDRIRVNRGPCVI